MDHDKVNGFPHFIFQTTSTKTLKEILNDFVDLCNTDISKRLFDNDSIYSNYTHYSEETLRFWKLDPLVDLNEMFTYTRTKCKKSTSYEYRIEFKGTYILKDPSITLDEAEVSENDYVFVEARDSGKGWNFIGKDAPEIAKCDFCTKYQELPIQCACEKVHLFLGFLN